MQNANDEVKKMINKNDVEFQRVNRLFHSVIWKRTKSERLNTLLANLYSEAAQYRRMTMIQPGRLNAVYEEHQAFLEALFARDAEKAEQCVRDHYESTLRWLSEILLKEKKRKE